MVCSDGLPRGFVHNPDGRRPTEGDATRGLLHDAVLEVNGLRAKISVLEQRITELEGMVRDAYRCPLCHGTGKRPLGKGREETCGLCDGRGHSTGLDMLIREGKMPAGASP